MKNLVIVESPAKAKTIEKFLGADYKVMSSYGHIRDLAQKEMSIDISNNFEPQYQISDDKRAIVGDLQKAIGAAEKVWLASDEDREGEAIAWHLLETLGLDAATTSRIVFNEITKTAITHAIANPRLIDMNLVNAQQARRVLDRLVGYEISPLLWTKIKPALSAGRVQSVSVRLIVEREEEIKQFQTQEYYKVKAIFHTGGSKEQIAAELSRTLKSEAEAEAFLRNIAGVSFEVARVETKPARRTPAAPFTTSTLQQEASRKLGLSVARTMQIAQHLYEEGYITYMRTDSVNLSTLALDMVQQEVTALYGEQYSKRRQYQTKTKGAQEAHEAIRPTDMSRHSIGGDNVVRRLYELIWKRTIASQMADAELERTTIEIAIGGKTETFNSIGEQVLFDGFLKVYFESTDDEPEDNAAVGLLPRIAEHTMLAMQQCTAQQHYTQHPPRYTQASLVKKLEELGIGRPSTYAPTISTILKREYVVMEDREGALRNITQLNLSGGEITKTVRQEKSGSEKSKLYPTDIGTVVNSFLMKHFTEILDYNFTATVEKDFDDIAEGKKEWRSMIKQFYVPFHEAINDTEQNSQKATGERLIGVDPTTGKNVYAKIGRYGTIVQIGDTKSDEKPRFASLKKGQSIERITLEEALALFVLPRTVGQHEGQDVVVSIGRFGPYVRLEGKFYSLGKGDDPYEVTYERCMEVVAAKQASDAEKERLQQFFPHEVGVYENEVISSNVGRFGPYLTYKGSNHKLPKGVDPLSVSLEEAIAILQAAETKKPSTRRTKKTTK